MASFIQHVTLTPSTVASYTFTDNSSAFEILNRNGAGEIYISHDGTAAPVNPTVGGSGFDVVPAAVGAAVQVRRSTSSQLPITVKVISAAATAISVRSMG
jgi:hypothetical protein